MNFGNNNQTNMNNSFLNQFANQYNYQNNPFFNPMNNFNLINQNINQMNNMNLMNQNMNQMNNMNFINQNMNQINNINFMNQNINQKNNINFLNQNMNNNNNHNLNDLDYLIDFMKLINLIIKFYERNGNCNMNYNNKNQIKSLIKQIHFNTNGIDCKIKDPLYYLNEPKIQINFINSDYNVFKVKIPKSITNYDLYTIAKKYKSLFLSKILLIHNNNILDEDESNIESILDNDNIIIIENRNYPNDDSYYNYLSKTNEKKLNILFTFCTGIKTLMALPINTKICEMINAYFLRTGFDEKNYTFLYDGKKLYSNDERKISEILVNLSNIQVNKNNLAKGGFSLYILGKEVEANIINKKRNPLINIGLLNSTQDLINYYNYSPNYEEYIENQKVEKLVIIEEKIINEEKCLASLGIKGNFICRIECKNQ